MFTTKTNCLALLTALLGGTAYAAEPAPYADSMLGDWHGAKPVLENMGITAQLLYKFDVISNVSGGNEQGVRGLDNADAIFTFDGEKLAGATGLTGKIHLLNNNGGRPDGDLVGSAQGIDNIEVKRATGKLYQAYLDQSLLDNHVSVLAGLYDLNSEFYVTDSSALFLHSTFGMATDFAQSGENGPSIFPYTALASRIRVNPTNDSYAQFAILDGVAGDPNHREGTHVDLDKNDGWLLVSEAGYKPDGGKVAVGGWSYTQKFDHQTLVDSNGDPVKKRSQGAYLLGEKRLYAATPAKDLTGFVRVGVANGEVNQFDYALSAGLVYTGLFPTRDEGKLGFGVTQAHNSSDYKQSMLAGGTPVDTAETTFELTYSDKLTPWLTVQPDVQYVVNPSTDKTLDNALVIGMRTTINF